MAIQRTAWIDDDGTGTTGTVVNNAEKQLLYDQIDAALAGYMPVNPSGYITRDLLWQPDATYDIGKSVANRPRDGFYSRNLNVAGSLSVTGLGTHGFNGTGSGGNRLSLANAADGSGNYISLDCAAGAASGVLQVYAPSWGATGAYLASGMALEARGLGGLSLVAAHASGAIRFYSGGGGFRAQIHASGSQQWFTYGAGTATFDAVGNITSVSDARVKNRIAPLPYGLAEILQLFPKQHGYTEDSGLDCQQVYGGFLAHEVQSVMPIAVGQDGRGYLTLADRPILGALVNAIKELTARLAIIEGRL